MKNLFGRQAISPIFIFLASGVRATWRMRQQLGINEEIVEKRCIDSNSYQSPQGLPCQAYLLLDCKRLGQVGFTKQLVEELLLNCPKSCGVAECSTKYNYRSSESSYLHNSSYVNMVDDQMKVKASARSIRRSLNPQPIGVCREIDDQTYKSPQGGGCVSFEGLDCTMFYEIGFSEYAVYELTRSCPTSCNITCGMFTLSPSSRPSLAPSVSIQPSHIHSNQLSHIRSSQTSDGRVNSSTSVPNTSPRAKAAFIALGSLVVLIGLVCLKILLKRRRRQQTKERKIAPISDMESNGKGSSREEKIMLSSDAAEAEKSAFSSATNTDEQKNAVPPPNVEIQDNLKEDTKELGISYSDSIEHAKDSIRRLVRLSCGSMDIETVLRLTSSSMTEEDAQLTEIIGGTKHGSEEIIQLNVEKNESWSNASRDSNSIAEENKKLKKLVSDKYGPETAETILRTSSTESEDNDRLYSFVSISQALEAKNIKIVLKKSSTMSSDSDTTDGSVDSHREDTQGPSKTEPGVFSTAWLSPFAESASSSDDSDTTTSSAQTGDTPSSEIA